MHRHFIARFVSFLCPVLVPCTVAAQRVDDKTVEDAIQAGVAALERRINPLDELEYLTPDTPPQTRRVRGEIVKVVGGLIHFRTTDGQTLSIPQNRVVQRLARGHIEPEMDGYYYGGPTALAALALVSAGVEMTDAKLAMLLAALAADDARESGTYVHSLRAATWSALLERRQGGARRRRYHKLLTAERKWLTKAMQSDGGYGYTQTPANGWDHSNTQFGNLGLWAAGVSKIEVDRKTLQKMAHHWLETQHETGGWSYRRETDLATSSMTVAGCNSLYIALDQLYSRSGGAYRLFEGIRLDKAAEAPVRKICAAIERGDRFLRKNPPDPEPFSGYELFGLERLGLASGQCYLGGVDWFRHYVESTAVRSWGQDPVGDAFAVIFLVHGRAPVLMQRMVVGDQDRETGYYYRDLANLTRYLSHTFERLHRWQRLPVDADLRSLEDAPLLYLSGRKRLELPDAALRRIREYIDRGGVVFLHADGASKEFTESAEAVFERMYRDRGYRFSLLEKSHPVYHCANGAGGVPWKHLVPLRGLSDGSRIMAFLCPVDIAGAWHQNREGFDDLFKIMANIRVYALPPYAQLPRPLRSARPSTPAAPSYGVIHLLRWRYEGRWDAHPDSWGHYSTGLSHRTGIELVLDESNDSLDERASKLPDLVHLTVQKPIRLEAGARKKLKDYLNRGGLLLIDAADGQPAGVDAVRDVLNQIDVGERGVLPADHPIFRGAFRGGRSLTNLETTEVGTALARGGAGPPILTRSIQGRIVVLACPFDLVAGLDGHFIWNRSGFLTESTERIVDNIFLWRQSEKKK